MTVRKTFFVVLSLISLTISSADAWNPFSAIRDAGERAVSGIQHAGQQTFNTFKSGISNIIHRIPIHQILSLPHIALHTVQNAANTVKNQLQNVSHKAIDFAKQNAQKSLSLAKTIESKAVSGIKGLPSQIEGLGMTVVGKLVAKILGAPPELKRPTPHGPPTALVDLTNDSDPKYIYPVNDTTVEYYDTNGNYIGKMEGQNARYMTDTDKYLGLLKPLNLSQTIPVNGKPTTIPLKEYVILKVAPSADLPSGEVPFALTPPPPPPSRPHSKGPVTGVVDMRGDNAKDAFFLLQDGTSEVYDTNGNLIGIMDSSKPYLLKADSYNTQLKQANLKGKVPDGSGHLVDAYIYDYIIMKADEAPGGVMTYPLLPF